MATLTLKENQFLKEVSTSLNPTEAVRKSYDISNPKTSTASVMAHQLLNKPKIKRALEIILKELKITKEDRLRKMAEILYDTDKRTSIEANKEISKMVGDYAPIKTELADLREERADIIKPE